MRLLIVPGPFLETAPAVIESALRVGSHYLDIAAEQRAVRQTLATYHAEAMDKRVVVLPAMAFYGGLADLLVAQLCAGLRSVDEILIGVGLGLLAPNSGNSAHRRAQYGTQAHRLGRAFGPPACSVSTKTLAVSLAVWRSRRDRRAFVGNNHDLPAHRGQANRKLHE